MKPIGSVYDIDPRNAWYIASTIGFGLVLYKLEPAVGVWFFLLIFLSQVIANYDAIGANFKD